MEASEAWREIPNMPSYFVSSFGRVRRHAKIKRLSPSSSGHLTCEVLGHPRKVHQLVATAFIGERPLGLVTMHLNHIPWDNRPENLQYGTVGENIRMDFKTGTRSHRGEQSPKHILNELDVIAIRSSSLMNSDLALVYNIGRSAISKVRRSITWTHVQSVADSLLVGKPPTGESHMAKAPKTISAADKKVQLANLKALLKGQAVAAKTVAADQKAAAAALALAKKAADAEVKEAMKVADVKRKAADAAIATAQKNYAMVVVKADKSATAIAKGTEKLTTQMAALEAMPVDASVKAVKASKPKLEAA